MHPAFCLSFLWSCGKFSFGACLRICLQYENPCSLLLNLNLVRDCRRVAQIHPRSFLVLFKYLDETSVECKLGFLKGFFSSASIHMFHFLVGEASSLIVFEHLWNFIQSQKSTWQISSFVIGMLLYCYTLYPGVHNLNLGCCAIIGIGQAF